MDTRSPDWPKKPNILTQKLKYHKETLQEHGLKIESGRNIKGRFIKITRLPHSESPMNDDQNLDHIGNHKSTVMLEDSSVEGYDGHDGYDGQSRKIPDKLIPTNPDTYPPDWRGFYEDYTALRVGYCGDTPDEAKIAAIRAVNRHFRLGK